MKDHTTFPYKSLKDENQYLREINEIAIQITAHLDEESILKNVVWSLVAKFQMKNVTFLLIDPLER